MAVTRSRLFVLSPTASAATAAAALETWATQREVDLGFPNGLTTALLQFSPANNSAVTQGLLRLYRIRQFYRASSTLPALPVVGEGALLTLEATAAGVVAVKGTIIDPRAVYAYSSTQASSGVATNSIRQHVSARTGVPIAQITVSSPTRVAVPHAGQIGWHGSAYRGLEMLATVTVSANPSLPVLPVLRYDTAAQEALSDTVPILVRTDDPTADPWLDPLVEVELTTLADGTPILGSLDGFSGDTQLASEAVVLVDVQGGNISNLTAASTFERFTSPSDEFDQSQPGSAFFAQRNYRLVRSAYSVTHRVAVGKWDSALQFFRPMGTSGYAPGAFAPRMITLYNHESTGAAGMHQAFGFQDEGAASALLAVYPEIVQRPSPAGAAEVVSTFEAGAGLQTVDSILHEFGHAVETFMGPGVARQHVPGCEANCDTVCDADTTDESWPLDETVAQMISMWMLRRLYPDMPHARCDLMQQYIQGGTDDQARVHSAECIVSADELNLFLRDDDPACPDLARCDRPDRVETDDRYGVPNNCRTTDGYNVFSVLQAWWNTLNGLYCEPTPPFTCYEYAPEWPVGCGGPGAPTCVTADEAAGLALLYALRTNPLSYSEFFDAMARFVGCNYGEAAYEVFNQGLCDHAIRSCSEPLPLDCESCGNGIREGGENCDGTDLTVDEVGVVPQCTDFPGYVGGVLACSASCELDFSGCGVGPGSGTATDPGGSDTSGGPGSVGQDGCACSGGGGEGLGPHWWLAVGILLARQRRRRALALAVTVSACSPSEKVVPAEDSTSVTSDDGMGATTTGDIIDGWPDLWFGQYYSVGENITLGAPSKSEPYFDTFYNISFERETFVVDHFNATGERVGTFTSTPVLDHGFVVVNPSPGDTYVDIPPAQEGKARVELRPYGDDCGSLVMRIVYREPSPDGPEFTDFTSHRGHICLLEPLQEEPDYMQDTLLIDLCPDAPPPAPCTSN
jgi:MYXO-CTERM domain-containing protein